MKSTKILVISLIYLTLLISLSCRSAQKPQASAQTPSVAQPLPPSPAPPSTDSSQEKTDTDSSEIKKKSPIPRKEILLRPKDEAAKDPSFVAFRNKLLSALRRRDSKALLPLLGPGAGGNSYDCGGKGLPEDLKECWEYDKDDGFWKTLESVLSKGTSYKIDEDGPQVSSPYWAEALNFDGYEERISSVISAANVPLREEPSFSSRIVARLSYNVIFESRQYYNDKKPNDDNWYQIETLGGLKGYVESKYVWDTIEYTAYFTKEKGKWQLTSLTWD